MSFIAIVALIAGRIERIRDKIGEKRQSEKCHLRGEKRKLRYARLLQAIAVKRISLNSRRAVRAAVGPAGLIRSPQSDSTVTTPELTV